MITEISALCAAGEAPHRLFQFFRPHVARRRVDQITRQEDAVGDAANTSRIDAGRQDESQRLARFLAITGKDIAAERQRNCREFRLGRRGGEMPIAFRQGFRQRTEASAPSPSPTPNKAPASAPFSPGTTSVLPASPEKPFAAWPRRPRTGARPAASRPSLATRWTGSVSPRSILSPTSSTGIRRCSLRDAEKRQPARESPFLTVR